MFYDLNHLCLVHQGRINKLCLIGPTPASFGSFLFFSNSIFTEKCRLQGDSNTDRQSEGKHGDHLTTTAAHKTNWMETLERNCWSPICEILVDGLVILSFECSCLLFLIEFNLIFNFLKQEDFFFLLFL